MEEIKMNTDPTPLRLTNNIASKYPNCWKYIEEMRQLDVVYDNSCYIPISACNSLCAISLYGKSDHFTTESALDASLMAAVAGWRQHKQIYRFDKDMEETLLEQNDKSLTIPVEILKSLPYTSLYIKTNTLGYHEKKLDGFFVYFDNDDINTDVELRFLGISEESDTLRFPVAIHLIPNGSIEDGIKRMIQVSIENSKKAGAISNFEKKAFNESIESGGLKACLEEFSSRAMQLVLYICAQNKEVEEDPKQRQITKKPKKPEFIKDKYREIQMWNCGEKTGAIIRKMHTTAAYRTTHSEAKTSVTGTPKRPHSRRGHWHHFWTGSEKNQSRKLILKWVSPTFIHGNDTTESPVQINIVIDEKNGDMTDVR